MAEFGTQFPNIDAVKKSKKIKAVNILLKSTVYSFAIFGFLFILLLLAIIGFLRQDYVYSAPVPKQAVLDIDLDKVYGESRADDLLSDFAETSSTSFYDLVKAINLAALDERVAAIAANIGDSSFGISQLQELRRSIAVFRSTGKKAYIYSTGFGSFGNGTGEYYLASVFDKIYMQPNSEAGITGIGIEVPFLKGTLDKIGVEPEFVTRYEYKNAMASLTAKGFSKEHKAEVNKLGSDLFTQFLVDAAQSRSIDSIKLEKLVNKAPISSEEALKEGLIDKVAYRSEMIEDIKKEHKKVKPVTLVDYAGNLEEVKGNVPTLGFLVLDGVITEGDSVSSPLDGDAVVGSRTVLQQLEDMSKDKNLKALVVRLNSPGGSYTASNEIWHALNKFKSDKKIPLVVSMGDYAASGGYFVALAGDKIFAERATITGSIGVFGGKIVLAELWKKIGVNWGEVKFGDNSTILSSNHKFSKKELERFNASLDNIYKDFTSKVSGARGIDLDTLDNFARGRVWSGRWAAAIGLVDDIGGIDAAIAEAKKVGGIEAGDRFSISYYPKAKTFQEKLGDLLGKSPKVSAKAILNDLGLDSQEISMLKRLKYDAALMPLSIKY